MHSASADGNTPVPCLACSADGIGVSYSTEFRFRCEGGHRSCEQCLGPSDPGRPRCDRVDPCGREDVPARAELFCLGAPGGSRHAGRLAVSPCTTLLKEVDANSAKPLKLSKAADYCPYCAPLDDPEL